MPFELAIEVSRLGCYLVESAVLPSGEVDAQEIGLGQASLASLGTVLLGAAAAGVGTDSVRPLIDVCERGVREGRGLASATPRPTDQTSWAVAQVLLGLVHFRSAVTAGTLERVRDELLRYQLDSGNWTFRRADGDDLSPALALYPTLALRKYTRYDADDETSHIALSRTQDWVSRELAVPHSPEDALLLLFLCQTLDGQLNEGAATAYARTLELVEAGTMSRLASNDFPASWSVMQGSQPLWYVRLDRQFVYLLTRRIWPPLHPINIAAASALLEGFDPIDGGWRSSSARSGSSIYSWATALGILGTSLLRRDLSRWNIDAETYSARVREVLDTTMKYDVVITFAGAQRATAERIVGPLKRAGYTVFYDHDRQHELLGEDLAIYLHKVYFSQSRFAVAVLSEDFVKSRWASNWEWKAILARMQQSRSAYLLPYFHEHVDVPGLNPTIGYISASTHSPEAFADIVIRKLRSGSPVADRS